MKQITLYLPEKTLKKLDEAVQKNLASDRANAIRDAIRDYLQLHGLW